MVLTTTVLMNVLLVWTFMCHLAKSNIQQMLDLFWSLPGPGFIRSFSLETADGNNVDESG